MIAVLRWLHRRTEDVAVALLAAMFIAFMFQIGSRYIFNAPMDWTLEACLTTWLWGVFWGGAFLLKDRDHVKFDVLYNLAPVQGRRVMALLSAGAIAIAFAAALPATLDYIAFYKIKSSMVMGWRLDFVFSVYGIFAIAVIVYYGLRAFVLLRGASPDDLDRASDQS
ncbi:MAG TPA: TRAP transporter small permease subunit [Rhabdaerophilum sp.]|nr:TRAP transporter small permease subunit [Rhabdaerophilum sp.]